MKVTYHYDISSNLYKYLCKYIAYTYHINIKYIIIKVIIFR